MPHVKVLLCNASVSILSETVQQRIENLKTPTSKSTAMTTTRPSSPMSSSAVPPLSKA
ncbi:MAG: hypothetical protein Q9218_008206 [Villophora microphyllina]